MSIAELFGYNSEPETTVKELSEQTYNLHWEKLAARLPEKQYNSLINELLTFRSFNKLEAFLRKFPFTGISEANIRLAMLQSVEASYVHQMVTQMEAAKDPDDLLDQLIRNRCFKAAEYLVLQFNLTPTPMQAAIAEVNGVDSLTDRWKEGKKTYQPLLEAYIAKNALTQAQLLLKEEKKDKKNKLVGTLTLLEGVGDDNWPLYGQLLNRLAEGEEVSMQQLCMLAVNGQLDLLKQAWGKSGKQQRWELLDWLADQPQRAVVINLDLSEDLVTVPPALTIALLSDGEWPLLAHALRQQREHNPSFLDPAVKAGQWKVVEILLRDDTMEPTPAQAAAAQAAGQTAILQRMNELGVAVTDDDIARYFVKNGSTGQCPLETEDKQRAVLATQLRKSGLHLTGPQLDLCVTNGYTEVYLPAIMSGSPFHQGHYDLVLIDAAKAEDPAPLRALVLFMANKL